MILSLFCSQNFVLVLLARDEFSIQFPGVALAGTLWKVMSKSRKEKNMYLLRFFLSLHVGRFFKRWACVIAISAQKPSDDSKKGMIMLALMIEDICLVHFQILDILIQSETKRYRSIMIKKCLAVSGSARLRVCIRLYHPIIVASFLGVGLFVSSTLSSLLLRIL